MPFTVMECDGGSVLTGFPSITRDCSPSFVCFIPVVVPIQLTAEELALGLAVAGGIAGKLFPLHIASSEMKLQITPSGVRK
jgi:hypothetical protein